MIEYPLGDARVGVAVRRIEADKPERVLWEFVKTLSFSRRD